MWGLSLGRSLSCPVSFAYRGDEVAAQAATGAVRYDISIDPVTGRWYLDASWKTTPGPAPGLRELRAHPVLAVDVNAGHLAAWAFTPDGNPAGPPVTIPLVLAGLPATQRDGRIRAAVTRLIGTARTCGARAVVIENLDFAQARAEGRERAGNRPSRGWRGKRFRALVSGIPSGRFRDRLVQMTFNAGLAVIAVDPAYTTKWGAEHWLAPLEEPDSDPRQRPSRRRRGDRAARPRAPGAATGRRDRRRPADRSPESCPHSTRQPQHRAEERRHPPGLPAAPPGAQDRTGPAGTTARPGSRRPFAAAGQPGQSPAISLGTVSRAPCRWR